MSEGAVFIDIFSRLNLASVERVLKDVQTAMREGGKSSSRAFGEGFTLDGAKAQFSELAEASRAAYRDMESGLQSLQIQEARINDLRARNFKQSSEVMIAAQRDFDAALTNSMRLQETAAARSTEARTGRALAADTAAWRRNTYDPAGREDRGGRGFPVPLGRVGRTLGIGAAIGTVAGGADSVKQAAKFEDSMNRLVTVTQELASNIPQIAQEIQRIAVSTGTDPQELGNVALQGEKRGYRGRNLGRLLDVTAQLSRQEKIPLDEALKGIGITAENYKKNPDQLADLASQLNVAVGRSGTSMQGFVSALPNVEPRAAAAGIPQEQVWGVLAQLTRSGLEPQRAAQNEDSLIRSLAAPNGPMRDMLNTLFTQGGAKNAQGKPMTAADIQNNLPTLGLPGAVNEIINKGVLPNLTAEQRVLLPAVFKNAQNQENIEDMMGTFTDPKTLEFANSAAIQGGALSPMQVSKAALKAGVPEEDISRLRDLAKAQQVQHGFGAQLKGRDSDVQSIAGVLRKGFGTAEASRVAMTIGYGDNDPQGAQAGTAAAVQDIGAAHADAQGNVEGFKQSMDTTLAQTDRAKAAWHNVAITLGHELSPAVKDVMSGLADFGDWLSSHQGALEAFAGTLTTIAGIWAGDKLAKGLKGFIEPTTNLLGKLGGALSPGNLNTVANPFTGEAATASLDGAASALTGSATALEGAATALSGAAGAETGAAGAQSGAATALDGAASAETGAATALDGSATALDGSAVEMAGLGSKILGAINPVLIAGLIAKESINQINPHANDAAPPKEQRSWLDTVKSWMSNGEADNHPGTASPGAHPQGKARGGIVGYKSGTGEVDPYSQPLMGQRDTGGDSILGSLGGKPVGLRGGEGILTPEAVARLGGKDTVDGLNAGENPWADPLKVGSTFFGSFSTGVAKYSPWGKYLTAGSHTLDDMVKAFDTSTKDHEGGSRGGPVDSAIEQMLASGMAPDQVLQQIGAVKGKRGGYEVPGMGYLSGKDKSLLGLPTTASGKNGMANKIYNSVIAAGYDPGTALAAVAASQYESGLNPNQWELGGSDHYGLFQEDGAKPRSGADQQIGWFVGALNAAGGPGAINGGNARQVIADKVEVGGYSGSNYNLNTARDAISAGSWGSGGSGKGLGRFGGFSTGGIVGYDAGTSNVGGILNPGGVGQFGAGGAKPPSLDNSSIAPPDRSVPGPGGLPGQPAKAPAPGGGPLGLPTQSNRSPGSSQGPLQDMLGGKNPQFQPAPKAVVPGEENKTPEELTPQGTQQGQFGHPSDDRNVKENPSQGVGTVNSKGFGVSGGILGAAEGAAEAGANAMAPGAGQGMQIAFQLANRAIGYAGQLVGIGLEGLTETFLPHDSPKTQASSNLFGKIALGIAGAHPGPENMAAMGSALQMKPKEDMDQGAAQAGQVMPMVQMHNTTINHNGGDVSGQMQKGITQALFGAGQLAG